MIFIHLSFCKISGNAWSKKPGTSFDLKACGRWIYVGESSIIEMSSLLVTFSYQPVLYTECQFPDEEFV